MSDVLTRRSILKRSTAILALATGALGLPGSASASGRTIRIGVASPYTGSMAAHAEPVPFILKAISEATGGVINVKGVSHPFEFVTKDTQSNPNRAAEIAQELIFKDKVDIVLCYGGPENANPISDQCELNGVPCLASDVPIESWFYGRGGDPAVGFKYTFCSFFDVATFSGAMVEFMKKLPTNHIVGGLWANDADGAVLSKTFTTAFSANGCKIVDPGRFDLPASSYATQIAAFRAANAEIVQCVVPPPAFTLFWTQCAQQGYQPKAVIAAKSSEYPPAINPLGERAVGIAVPIWWTPQFPFSSSVTKQTAIELARTYEAAEKRQWSAVLGSHHAMIEVILDALARTEKIDDPDSIRDALKATNLKTICGQVNFTTGPVPNSSKMGLVSVQWDHAPKGYEFPFDMVIVENSFQKEVPVARAPFPIPYA